MDFIQGQIIEKRKEFKSSSKYCLRPILILMIVTIATPLIVRYYNEIKVFLTINNIPEWVLVSIIVFLALLAAYELTYRSYIADKEKVKRGLTWIGTLGLEKCKKTIINKYYNIYENEYKEKHPSPKEQELLEINNF